jgi:hypothetical protein
MTDVRCSQQRTFRSGGADRLRDHRRRNDPHRGEHLLRHRLLFLGQDRPHFRVHPVNALPQSVDLLRRQSGRRGRWLCCLLRVFRHGEIKKLPPAEAALLFRWWDVPVQRQQRSERSGQEQDNSHKLGILSEVLCVAGLDHKHCQLHVSELPDL